MDVAIHQYSRATEALGDVTYSNELVLYDTALQPDECFHPGRARSPPPCSLPRGACDPPIVATV